MTKLEQAIAKAKAGLTTAARKKMKPPMLFKGQVLNFAGPMYAVVDSKGRMSYYSHGDGPRMPAIYYTRKDAREAVVSKTDRVVRLDELAGRVL